MKTVDVAIIGGGMAGGTLALALQAHGLDVAVVDHEPIAAQLDARYDGRALAIAYACFRQWQVLGLGDDLIPVAGRIDHIVVSDGAPAGRKGVAPSPLTLRFLSDELGRGDEALGYMLEARHIRAALNTAIIARGITRYAPAQPVAYTPGAVTLADGTVLRAKLVVGADGRGSWLRKQAGIDTVGWDYHQDALVLTVAAEHSHANTAHELFLPSGPFAILPLTDNRLNIVWTEKRAVADALMALPEDVRWAAFLRRFGPHLGAVTPLTPVWRYPLSLQTATDMVAPRAALVGDAAHGIHPLAGQGLNLGLKDVAALTEVLVTAQRRGEDIGSDLVLARYAQWRRPDAQAMALGMDGFYRLFANQIGRLQTLRRLGLAAVDAIAPLRRGFARTAGADTGATPKLLRGELV